MCLKSCNNSGPQECQAKEEQPKLLYLLHSFSEQCFYGLASSTFCEVWEILGYVWVVIVLEGSAHLLRHVGEEGWAVVWLQGAGELEAKQNVLKEGLHDLRFFQTTWGMPVLIQVRYPQRTEDI